LLHQPRKNFILRITPLQLPNPAGFLVLSELPDAESLWLLATGTGIAPIRSLIYERLTHPDPAPMLLFFGNRNRTADFFFDDEWERLVEKGVLRIFTAFSRDQEDKVYVQHVLRSQARQLGELIPQNTIFSVCGGSSKMADACKEAVFTPFKEGGDKEEREKILSSLTWWQEIWS
jgi:sulfite reductase alpha subunit-like flavoprotein